MEENNNIVSYTVGDNTLSLQFGQTGQALSVMDSLITQKATANLAIALEGIEDEYSVPEKRAMLLAEEIKLTNDFDFMKLILRGKRIVQIRDEGLWSMHPNGYGSLEMMSKDLGMSMTELSNTLTLYEVVFPWLVENGGPDFDLVVMFEDIGKANLFEILPYLRAIITGEESMSDTVNDRLNEIIEQINELAPGLELETLQARVVDEILDAGRLPNREMRRQLRPNRTPPIEALLISQGNGRYSLAAELSEDQRQMLVRILNSHIDATFYELPENETQRTRELLQIQSIREIARLIV